MPKHRTPKGATTFGVRHFGAAFVWGQARLAGKGARGESESDAETSHSKRGDDIWSAAFWCRFRLGTSSQALAGKVKAMPKHRTPKGATTFGVRHFGAAFVWGQARKRSWAKVKATPKHRTPKGATTFGVRHFGAAFVWGHGSRALAGKVKAMPKHRTPKGATTFGVRHFGAAFVWGQARKLAGTALAGRKECESDAETSHSKRGVPWRLGL